MKKIIISMFLIMAAGILTSCGKSKEEMDSYLVYYLNQGTEVFRLQQSMSLDREFPIVLRIFISCLLYTSCLGTCYKNVGIHHMEYSSADMYEDVPAVFFQSGMVSVSYTHLDVYKRQTLPTCGKSVRMEDKRAQESLITVDE